MEGVSVEGPESHHNSLVKVGFIYKNQTLYAYDDLKECRFGAPHFFGSKGIR